MPNTQKGSERGRTSNLKIIYKKKRLSNNYIDKLYFDKVDNKGRNFLHIAVQNSDIETVLSLISVNVNINSRVKDSQSKTGLHLAAEAGSEMIIRNLVSISQKEVRAFSSFF